MTAMIVMAALSVRLKYQKDSGLRSQDWRGVHCPPGTSLVTLIVFWDIISHIVQLQHRHQPIPFKSYPVQRPNQFLYECRNFLETRRIILLNNMFIKKIGSCGFILHSTLFTRATSDSAPHEEISNKKCDWSEWKQGLVLWCWSWLGCNVTRDQRASKKLDLSGLILSIIMICIAFDI